MTWRTFWTLRRQLIAVLLGSLGVLLIASGLTVRGRILDTELTQVIDLYSRSIDALAPLLQDHVITQDVELDLPVLQRVASEYLERNPEVLDFELRGPGEAVLVDVRRENAVRPEMVHELKRELLAGAHPVGQLRLSIDLGTAHRVATESVRSLQLMLTGSVAALALVLVFWFDRLAVRPIQMIDRRLRAILADGHGEEVHAELHISGAPELVRLGNSLRAMGDVANLQRHEQELREQLQQSQKLESVGRLAGGVAHDFNNLLTVILGYAEAIKEKRQLPPDVDYNAEQIVEAGRRASALTRQLLAFSRKQVLSTETLKPSEAVQGMKDLLSRLIDAPFELEFMDDPDVGQISADLSQLEQVILNLAVNARDAMADGGVIRFRTYNAGSDSASGPWPPNVPSGDYVVLEVGDTGIGMSSETIEHIFEPFFTTKGEAEGTGLGLSMVYGIVQQSEGFINVESVVGEGTKISIYFPRVDTRGVPAQEATIDLPEVLVDSSEMKILLVDDEEMVQQLTCGFLRGAGYQVVTAGSAEHALELFREVGDEIHLLVTDLNLPGMSGAELLNALREERPEMRGLVISGYDSSLLTADEQRLPFLQKPFEKQELLHRVSSLLGQAVAATP